MRAHVETDEVALVAQVHQLPVERVRPAVVGADETVATPAVGLDQWPAAVPARVVERADLAVLAADDEDRRAGLGPEHEAAGIRQFVRVAGVEPGALPQALALGLEEGGIVVAAARNRGETRKAIGRALAARLVLHAVEEATDESFCPGSVHGR